MQLIDSHCHLDLARFDADRDEVLERAHAAGVAALIVPATTAAGWSRLREICAAYPNLYPAYGLHPMFLSEHRQTHLHQLRELIERERPCAIGECGLDHYLSGLDPSQQRHYFRSQLELAADLQLPVIVHARRALDEVIALIRAVDAGRQRLRGVIHSFSGSVQQAERLADLGFLIGLGGPLTYPRAQRLRRLVATMPLPQLLLETDAPDQPDQAIRGQRNEPSRLSAILDCIAELRGQPAAQIAEQTTVNARRLFGLPAC